MKKIIKPALVFAIMSIHPKFTYSEAHEYILNFIKLAKTNQ